MKLPFKTPIWRDGNTLVAADSELIGVVEAATPEELDFIVRAVNDWQKNHEALRMAAQLFDEALPKFNWNASFLDHQAITLLNTVPPIVHDAIGWPHKEQPS